MPLWLVLVIWGFAIIGFFCTAFWIVNKVWDLKEFLKARKEYWITYARERGEAHESLGQDHD